jgi:hypothetical protein
MRRFHPVPIVIGAASFTSSRRRSRRGTGWAGEDEAWLTESRCGRNAGYFSTTMLPRSGIFPSTSLQ